MHRAPGVKTACLVGIAAATLILAGCAKEAGGPAAYPLEQCRRVGLLDAESGGLVRGAEDLAIDASGGRLFVSAYDRRAAERAAAKKATAIPEGGLYELPLADLLAAGAEPLKTRSLLRRGDVGGGLRPHGVTYDADAGEVIFINRGYQRAGGGWTMTPRIERIGANGEAFIGEPMTASCAANDVLSSDEKLLMTFDHGACGWRAGLEDLFGRKQSGIAAAGVGPVFSGASFANGIVRTLGGEIVMAATRENALLTMIETEGGLKPAERIKLPGGPDNLTLSFDGAIVAAVHPSMMRIGLQRKMGLGRAPSRIVKVDPDRGDVSILFDDPHAKRFAAATVAVETPEALIIGSVLEEGLLVCEKGE